MRIPATALAMLLTLALVACGGDDDGGGGPTDDGTARVRVIHLSPDAPALDIAVDGEVVADGITYAQVTDYQSVPAGSVEIAVAIDVNGSALVSATPTLARDADYTVFPRGFLADVEAVALADDNAPPDDGFLKLRLIHGSPSAPPVDLYHLSVDEEELGTPIVQNVAFGTTTAYLERSAGMTPDGSIVLTLAGTQTVLAEAGIFEFPAGHVMTFVLADATGGGTPFVDLFWDDQPEAP